MSVPFDNTSAVAVITTWLRVLKTNMPPEERDQTPTEFHQLLERDALDVRYVSVITNNMVESVEDQQPKQNHSLPHKKEHLSNRTPAESLSPPEDDDNAHQLE